MVLQDIKDKPNLRRELHGVDIMTATPPCFGRTVLREENGIDSSQVFKDDDLFRLQLELVQLLQPKRVLSEMTPPYDHFNSDHREVIHKLTNLGYAVTVTDRFPSDLCGDAQHRDRWILVARRKQPGITMQPFSLEMHVKAVVCLPLKYLTLHHRYLLLAGSLNMTGNRFFQ